MPKKSFTICFVPGWAENRWKTHQLFDGLIGAGGHFIDDIKTADVVITHSAGGHFADGDMKAQLVVVIGPIYGFNKPLVIMVAQEWFYDGIYYFRNRLFTLWLSKNLYYIFFGVFHPLRTLRTYSAIQAPFDLGSLAKYNALIIRNSRDHFCAPIIEQDAKAFKNITYVGLPGVHDDLWVNPTPYVDLILKHL